MPAQTLTAYPVVRDVPALIGFLEAVFGATEKFRDVGSAGGYHVELQIGDTLLMLGGGGTGVSWADEIAPMPFHIYVPDVDGTYSLALSNGAVSLQKPETQDWGERTANIQDPAGNLWYIATFQGEQYFSEGAPTVQPYLQPVHSEPLIDFLVGVFGAIEEGRAAAPTGAILHSTLKLGNSAMEICDANGIYRPMPGMFYLRVPDADSLYAKAIGSGATSISQPADQSYGDRVGAIRDLAGNAWYLAAAVSKTSAA